MSSMSLLGGAHIAEDASDEVEPEVVKLDDASGRPEGHPLSVTSAGAGRRTCVSNKFPGDVGAAGPGPTL